MASSERMRLDGWTSARIGALRRRRRIGYEHRLQALEEAGAGIGCDRLIMSSGSFLDGERTVFVLRDGGLCEVGVLGHNGDGAERYRTIPTTRMCDEVLTTLPAFSDWEEHYAGDAMDGPEWRLQARWDGNPLVDSEGCGSGPDGYGQTLVAIERSVCTLVGVRPRKVPWG